MGWARSAGLVIRALRAFEGEAEIGSLQRAFKVRAYRQWPYPRGAPLRFPAQHLSSMSLCSHALSRQPRRAVCERTLAAPAPHSPRTLSRSLRSPSPSTCTLLEPLARRVGARASPTRERGNRKLWLR